MIALLPVSVVRSLALTESPVSVTAEAGKNVLFHCAGTGITIAWIVDGLFSPDTSITDRGITSSTLSTSSGTVQSVLTVPATSVNNGTTVYCMVYPGAVTSSNATLTVLPGIVL